MYSLDASRGLARKCCTRDKLPAPVTHAMHSSLLHGVSPFRFLRDATTFRARLCCAGPWMCGSGIHILVNEFVFAMELFRVGGKGVHKMITIRDINASSQPWSPHHNACGMPKGPKER